MIGIFTDILMVIGILFFISTVIGLMRLPDFFSRIHAASKGDTLSSLCLLVVIGIFHFHTAEDYQVLVSLKIFFIIIFTFIASPTAAHSLIEAAFKTGAKHWKKGDK